MCRASFVPRVLALAALALGACLASCGADLAAIACHSDENCPTGLSCGPSGICVSGSVDASRRPDAPTICLSPSIRCPDGTCDDLTSDPAHCGACSIACATGQTCQKGLCLCKRFGDQVCGGRCVDPFTDNANCGSCGNVCPMGTVCSTGSCAGACFPGLTSCGGSCVDTSSDSANCGGCGNVCPSGTFCAGGSCGSITCSSPYTACSGKCVDLATDPRNCGSCGNGCSSSESCDSGICHDAIPKCPLLSIDCGSFCADVSLDANHCGDCTTSCLAAGAAMICSNGTCQTGSCSTFGGATCYDSSSREDCTTKTYNPIDCGACGHECSSGQACIMGSCFDFLPVSRCSACGGDYSTCCNTMDPVKVICVKGTSNCPP